VRDEGRVNPQAQFSHIRLWLYVGANTLPAVLQWLTLNYDTSPRGLMMLACSWLITFCVTTRAYMDGKTTDKVISEKIETAPSGTPPAAGNTESSTTTPPPPAPLPAPPITLPTVPAPGQ